LPFEKFRQRGSYSHRARRWLRVHCGGRDRAL